MRDRTDPPHQTYLDAQPDLRWRGRALADVFALLSTLAKAHPGLKHRRYLHGGAILSAFRPAAGEPMELTIARKEPFATDDGPARWEHEVDTFVRVFAIGHWKRDETQFHNEGPYTRLVEQAPVDLFANLFAPIATQENVDA